MLLLLVGSRFVGRPDSASLHARDGKPCRQDVLRRVDIGVGGVAAGQAGETRLRGAVPGVDVPTDRAGAAAAQGSTGPPHQPGRPRAFSAGASKKNQQRPDRSPAAISRLSPVGARCDPETFRQARANRRDRGFVWSLLVSAHQREGRGSQACEVVGSILVARRSAARSVGTSTPGTALSGRVLLPGLRPRRQRRYQRGGRTSWRQGLPSPRVEEAEVWAPDETRTNQQEAA